MGPPLNPVVQNGSRLDRQKSDPMLASQRFHATAIPSSPELRPAEHAVVFQYEEKCRELAGYVLANQRGLNTPKCREELAASIQRAIENYLAFEKGKSRYS
jgi:hypothetical protein